MTTLIQQLKQLYDNFNASYNYENVELSSIRTFYKQLFGFITNRSKLEEDQVPNLVDCCLLFVEYVATFVNLNKLNRNHIVILQKCLEIIGDISEIQTIKNAYLIHIAIPILNIVLKSNTSKWFTKELLKNLKIALRNTSEELRYALTNINVDYLFKLVDEILGYGDFEYQLFLIEVIFSMFSDKLLKLNASSLFPKCILLQTAFLNMNRNNFVFEARTFLNVINSKFKKVLSFKVKYAIMDKEQVQPPKNVDGSCSELWVDFNTCSKVISIPCRKNQFLSSKDLKHDEGMEIIKILFEDINMVKMSKLMENEFGCAQGYLILFQLNDRSVILYSQSVTLSNLKLVLFNNSEAAILEKDLLPSLFGDKFEKIIFTSQIESDEQDHEPKKARISTFSSGKYPPLKTTTSKTTAAKKSSTLDVSCLKTKLKNNDKSMKQFFTQSQRMKSILELTQPLITQECAEYKKGNVINKNVQVVKSHVELTSLKVSVPNLKNSTKSPELHGPNITYENVFDNLLDATNSDKMSLRSSKDTNVSDDVSSSKNSISSSNKSENTLNKSELKENAQLNDEHFLTRKVLGAYEKNQILTPPCSQVDLNSSYLLNSKSQEMTEDIIENQLFRLKASIQHSILTDDGVSFTNTTSSSNHVNKHRYDFPKTSVANLSLNNISSELFEQQETSTLVPSPKKIRKMITMSNKFKLNDLQVSSQSKFANQLDDVRGTKSLTKISVSTPKKVLLMSKLNDNAQKSTRDCLQKFQTIKSKIQMPLGHTSESENDKANKDKSRKIDHTQNENKEFTDKPRISTGNQNFNQNVTDIIEISDDDDDVLTEVSRSKDKEISLEDKKTKCNELNVKNDSDSFKSGKHDSNFFKLEDNEQDQSVNKSTTTNKSTETLEELQEIWSCDKIKHMRPLKRKTIEKNNIQSLNKQSNIIDIIDIIEISDDDDDHTLVEQKVSCTTVRKLTDKLQLNVMVDKVSFCRKDNCIELDDDSDILNLEDVSDEDFVPLNNEFNLSNSSPSLLQTSASNNLKNKKRTNTGLSSSLISKSNSQAFGFDNSNIIINDDGLSHHNSIVDYNMDVLQEPPEMLFSQSIFGSRNSMEGSEAFLQSDANNLSNEIIVDGYLEDSQVCNRSLNVLNNTLDGSAMHLSNTRNDLQNKERINVSPTILIKKTDSLLLKVDDHNLQNANLNITTNLKDLPTDDDTLLQHVNNNEKNVLQKSWDILQELCSQSSVKETPTLLQYPENNLSNAIIVDGYLDDTKICKSFSEVRNNGSSVHNSSSNIRDDRKIAYSQTESGELKKTADVENDNPLDENLESTCDRNIQPDIIKSNQFVSTNLAKPKITILENRVITKDELRIFQNKLPVIIITDTDMNNIKPYLFTQQQQSKMNSKCNEEAIIEKSIGNIEDGANLISVNNKLPIKKRKLNCESTTARFKPNNENNLVNINNADSKTLPEQLQNSIEINNSGNLLDVRENVRRKPRNKHQSVISKELPLKVSKQLIKTKTLNSNLIPHLVINPRNIKTTLQNIDNMCKNYKFKSKTNDLNNQKKSTNSQTVDEMIREIRNDKKFNDFMASLLNQSKKHVENDYKPKKKKTKGCAKNSNLVVLHELNENYRSISTISQVRSDNTSLRHNKSITESDGFTDVECHQTLNNNYKELDGIFTNCKLGKRNNVKPKLVNAVDEVLQKHSNTYNLLEQRLSSVGNEDPSDDNPHRMLNDFNSIIGQYLNK